MLNPAILVEVLSPSTIDYDQGEKLLDYQRIASLRHVVHVAHDEKRIDVFSREGGQWLKASFGPAQRAPLDAMQVWLDVDEIYRNPLASSNTRAD